MLVTSSLLDVADSGVWNQLFPFQAPVDPQGLQYLLEYLKEAYGNPPIYIHENGQSTSEVTRHILKSSSFQKTNNFKNMSRETLF